MGILQDMQRAHARQVRAQQRAQANEGASKGILVTTSDYGPASFEFASGKPLELIDGSNLLYLLAEHAEVNARIDASELD